jgi:hypothetical protein
MHNGFRNAVAAAALSGAALIAAPTALASTLTNAQSAGVTPGTYLQRTSAAPPPAYLVPARATKISSFSIMGNASTTSKEVLKVFRKTATAGTWKVIGQSATVSLKANALNKFATSIAVLPGDVLGMADVSASSHTAPIFGTGANPADTLAVQPGNYAVGSTYPANNQSPGGFALNVSAVVQLAPVITKVNPTAGPAAGGTAVTITGVNFTGATAVRFGTIAARAFKLVSSTQITATSPAHTAGTVDIRVVTPGGTSAVTKADQFTF